MKELYYVLTLVDCKHTDGAAKVLNALQADRGEDRVNKLLLSMYKAPRK